MSAIVKLLRGVNDEYTLDINAAPLTVGSNFAPPTSADVERGWTFDIHCTGASIAEIEDSLRRLQWFLDQAGDAREPVFLAYRSWDDYAFEPIFGEFGRLERYEVISGQVRPSTDWTQNGGTYERLNNRVTLQIQPYSQGRPVRVAQAKGAVFEDFIGQKDGRSRGTQVVEAVTNLFTNPVFGNSTPLNNWTDASNVNSAVNTDRRFVLFGDSSAYITLDGTTNRSFSQSLTTVASTAYVLTCYAKIQDGSAVSGSNVQLYGDGAGITTIYTAVGGGWYRMSGSFTAAGTSSACGVLMANDISASVYVDGFQLQAEPFATPLVYGDRLGCAWTGTAHASTSTSTAALLRLLWSDIGARLGCGTIRMAWKADFDSGDLTADMVMANDNSGGLKVFYSNSGNDWRFGDGTTTIDGAVSTFSAGDVVVLHATWGTGGIELYLNGASYASNATYTPPTEPTYIYVGSNNTPAQHASGTFMDFAVFDRDMSDAQVLADYNQITQIVGDDLRAGAVPYLWSNNGFDQTTNDVDGSDYFLVAAGVPGTQSAQVLATASVVSALNNKPPRIDRVSAMPREFDTNLYFDFVNDEASNVVSVGTTAVEIANVDINAPNRIAYNALKGKPITAGIYYDDAGYAAENLQIALRVKIGALGATYTTEYRTVQYPLSVPNDTISYTTDVYLPDNLINYMQGVDGAQGADMQFDILARRPAGASSANVTVEYAFLFVDMAGINEDDDTSAINAVEYGGVQVARRDAGASEARAFSTLVGTPYELPSDMITVIKSFVRRSNFVASNSDDIQLVLMVMPRYRIL